MFWLVVAGSREVKDTLENRTVVGAELVEATAGQAATLLVGDCRGLDELVLKLWRSQGNPNRENCKVFYTDWELGRKAGPLRNREMLQYAYDQDGAKQVLAFYQTGAENKGTADCANKARRTHFPVKEIWIR